MATLKRKTNNGYEPLPAMVVRKTNAENGNGIGTCSTSSGTALTVSLTGYELVQNGIVAVTFANDVPAGATLNINSKGAKPIYYKGAAIEADTIKADDTVMFCYDGTNYVVTSLGGNGGAPVNPNEIVNISLTQVGGNSADLTGASITITDNDSGDTILSTTWHGNTIVQEIDVNTVYTISVGTVSGYFSVPDSTYQAAYNYERNVSIKYIAPGIYAYYSDKDVKAYADADEDAIGVAVLTNTAKFVISKIRFSKAYSYYGVTCALVIPSNFTTYYNGYSDTMVMYNQLVSEGKTMSGYSCGVAVSDGGYIGSSGEWYIVYSNKSAINSMLEKIGESTLSGVYGTSTMTGKNSNNQFTHRCLVNMDSGNMPDGDGNLGFSKNEVVFYQY